MPITEAELLRKVGQMHQSENSRLRENYALARSLGFTTAEAKILRQGNRADIEALAKGRRLQKSGK